MNRIGDHALIGDCHSSALVGLDGSIDWACFPRFDSAALFCRLLDEKSGGHFQVAPTRYETSHQHYIDQTNVVVTTFESAEGVLEVTDCMPVGHFDPARPTAVNAEHAILRKVRCVRGALEVQMTLAPRFEYGAFVPRFRALDATRVEVMGGADALWLQTSLPVEVDEDAARATWQLSDGETLWLYLRWSPSHAETAPGWAEDDDAQRWRLEHTLAFWRRWSIRILPQGPYEKAVRRSALVLKALTYAPTGALVAAPTTSLPEQLGGERNWDYRYTWIRDATLTLTSLLLLGFREESTAFKRWIERTGAGRPADLQIMYGILGERMLPEVELGHLAGHRDSRPVRIGNAAVKQLQLDAYGQMLEAAFLYAQMGGEITATNWRFLRGLVEIVRERWRRPDQGIWEMRDTPRHFVHSKLHCWVALERGVRLAEAKELEAPLDVWREEARAVHDYLLEAAGKLGYFPQAVGNDEPDAAVLLVPALGLVAASDPLVEKTVALIRDELEHDGLVHRYRSADGLDGGEGAFLMCSFWLVDVLAFAGRHDEAEALLQTLLGHANSLGLFAEEVDPTSGEPLGNFPQAFTHMALVSSCAHVQAAKAGELPTGTACDFAEVALRRLLRGRAYLTG